MTDEECLHKIVETYLRLGTDTTGIGYFIRCKECGKPFGSAETEEREK